MNDVFTGWTNAGGTTKYTKDTKRNFFGFHYERTIAMGVPRARAPYLGGKYRQKAQISNDGRLLCAVFDGRENIGLCAIALAE